MRLITSGRATVNCVSSGPMSGVLFVLACLMAVSVAQAQTVDLSPTASFIANNGPKSNRVDFFLLSEGYTDSQLSTTFTSHINNVLYGSTGFFSTTGGNSGIINPYVRYQNFINVIRVDIKSQQSGVDQQNSSGTYTSLVDTALDGRQGSPVSQAIFVNHTKANNAIDAAGATLGYSRADADWRLVFANTSIYAGTAAGGTSGYPVFSAANTYARGLAVHESGHTNHNLEDEYSGSGTYTGSEPTDVNATKDPSGSKWSHWLGFNDPKTGLVGAYAGALGYNAGVYRPSSNTIMRDVFSNRPFDPVSREKVILDIYDIVNPIDSHSSTALTYSLLDAISIDVIDPAVINVQWLLGGSPLAGQADQTIDLDKVVSLLGPGSHTLTARAYDTILDHNFSNNASPDPLDLVRRDLHKLEQTIAFNVDIDWLVGDTDFDNDVDVLDLDRVTLAQGSSTIAGDAGSGDLNGDGLVNLSDLDILLDALPDTVLLGDLDGDGDVDNADLGRAVGNFTGSIANASKTRPEGDMDGDGDVDNADLGFIVGQFTGAAALPSLPLVSLAADAIPEPTSLTLVALGTLACLGQSRRVNPTTCAATSRRS